MRSGREAAAYAAELQRLVRFLGVSDGNMEEGSMRVDVNVSVRDAGRGAPFGTKVEVKNLNSFAAMSRAVDFEAARQAAVLDAGGVVAQETRMWDDGAQKTVSMRTKEGQADYRFLPEPDLQPLVVMTSSMIDSALLPELPAQIRERYAKLGLSHQDVLVLADSLDVSSFYDAALAAGADPKAAANWVMGDVTAHVKAEKVPSFAALKLTPASLAELTTLVATGAVSGKTAKDVLRTLLRDGGSPGDLVASQGLSQISDARELALLCDAVLAAHPGEVAKFVAGKDRVKGFLVGTAMKRSGGRANAALVDQIITARLRAAESSARHM